MVPFLFRKHFNLILELKFSNKGKTMRKGFTLSEVMLVLSVIGVIAALTIPGIVQNTQNKQTVIKLKKAFSVLSQATTTAIADNGGSFKGICSSSDHTCLLNKYLPYFSILKKCDAGMTNGNCWSPSTKYLNSGSMAWASSATAVLLSDGTTVHFEMGSSDCSSTGWWGTLPHCGFIALDFNGMNPPNIWGRDVFAFDIYENGVKPLGIQNDGFDTSCISSSSGIGCAAIVIAENTINY